ncbi:MAG: GEVED domain-containing protein, partial [Bacteroidota bacterium]
IVFEPGTSHKLRITYHKRDFGDLPEPKYTTDLAGGIEGAYHRVDSIDIEPDTSIVRLAPALYLGETPPDAERVAFKNEDATGDDINDMNASIMDDEDLDQTIFVDAAGNPTPLIAGEEIFVEIPVRNNLVLPAWVYVFIDFNDDGDFEDEGEKNIQGGIQPTDSLAVVPASGLDTAKFSFIAPDIPFADTIAVRVRISTSETLDANGGAPNGEVEDFFVELRGKDFGDLPDITLGTATNDFRTLLQSDGPRHAVPEIPLVFLGDTVDVEFDGQPDLDALGDDTDNLVNDEDGIKFLTPFVPGEPARIAYTVRNRDTLDAELFIFADFKNTTGTLDSVAQVTIPAGTDVEDQVITFDVPDDAIFDEGRAYIRARVTTDTAFINNPSPIGLAKDGEVEDYFTPIFKLGNIVWEDRNHNGRQDPEEINLGIDSVLVILRFGGVDSITGLPDGITQTTIDDPYNLTVDGGDDLIEDFVTDTVTDANGLFSFLG